MRKFFIIAWRIISFPLRAIWWLLSLPVKFSKRAYAFLTFEPEDRSISDAFSATIQKPAALLDHLFALRKHLFRMLVGVSIGVILCATFTTQAIDFLSKPIGGIHALKAIDVTETVAVFMRVALFGGIAVALPYIAFEAWLFAAPGLSARSRRMGLLGIPLAGIFFVAGLAFSYFVLLPTALPFLLNFMGIETIPRPSSYINFVTGLLFWLGIAFEFPLVIYVLTLMGIVKPTFLAHNWRIAVLVIAVLAAAITPTIDPVNMALVMGPMVMLYFLSIGMSYLALIGRKRQSEPTSPRLPKVSRQHEKSQKSILSSSAHEPKEGE
ncbi:MAG: twin-arginine translocase subunit TatC [Chloroflexi bacterium]|nr:twin-arginine translocase subunit TatC [Chloroflexota bacterium]